MALMVNRLCKTYTQIVAQILDEVRKSRSEAVLISGNVQFFKYDDIFGNVCSEKTLAEAMKFYLLHAN